MGLFGSKEKQVDFPQAEKPLRVKKAEKRFRFDGDIPKKGEQIGRYRRSLSWEGSMDYRRKYWDAGGLTLRRKLPEPINIKQYVTEQAYAATELLPETIVKKSPEIPVKKRNPHERKPERYGDELGLINPPSYIPSVLHVKQLLDTSIVAKNQVKRLKEEEMVVRRDYEYYRMYLWRAELPSNRPPEDGNQYNFREHEEYIQQCDWYRESAEKSMKLIKKLRDRTFKLETVLPLLKTAVENCFKVAINQADLPDETKNLILDNLWSITIIDCLHTYAQLKMMIFNLKLDWEKGMKISKTKEALMANYRNDDKDKIRVRTDANCVEAKCCKGTCKQDGKLCHRERYLNFKDREIIIRVSYGKCTIILPKEVFYQHAEVKQDFYDIQSLRPPQQVLAAESPIEILEATEPVMDNVLHGLTSSMSLVKHHTYELLKSFYTIRKAIQKTEALHKISQKGENSTIRIPLPLLSRFNFDSLRAALRELTDVFESIPTTIELCPEAEDLYTDEDRDEEDIQKLMAEIEVPTSFKSRQTYYRDLRDQNVHTWTYFKQDSSND